MAIAFVKKGTKATVDPGTTLSPTLASVVAGNLVVAPVSVSRFTTTAAALSLPAGWLTGLLPISVGNQGGYSTNVGLVYIKNASAGTQTAAWTGFPAGGSAAEGIVAEFSGLDITAPLDSAKNSNASGTAGLSGTTGSSGTASQSNVLWVAVAHAENGVNTATFTSTIAGWTTLANTVNNSAGTAWWCGYQIAAVNTAVNPAFSWTNSSIWAGAVVGFIPTPVGGVRLFVQSSLDGLSSTGPNQFNRLSKSKYTSLDSYYTSRAMEQRKFMAMVQR